MSRRKGKIRLKKITIVIGVCLLILIVCGIGIFVFSQNHFFSKHNNTTSIQKKIVPQKEEVDYEAKVFMVGDALIHWGVYNDAKQDDGSYDSYGV